MKTCLLVIDVQESFTRRPFFSREELPAYLQAQNRLIAAAQSHDIPIVRVFHHHAGALADNPFAQASGLVRPLQGLSEFDAAHTVYKTRHSALVGTGLDVWLVAQGVQRLVISGIRTTARHASDLGWWVDFVPDATLTWAMPQPDGSSLSTHDIHARTAAVLRDRFARVRNVAQVVQDWAEQAEHSTAQQHAQPA
jgi:nicotinamidase-related amidase